MSLSRGPHTRSATSTCLAVVTTLSIFMGPPSVAQQAGHVGVFARVAKVVGEVMGVYPAKITANTRLCEDLKIDVNDRIEIQIVVSQEFGRKIPDDTWDQLFTVGQIVNYINTGQVPAKSVEPRRCQFKERPFFGGR
jgi:acyl carrier protein